MKFVRTEKGVFLNMDFIREVYIMEPNDELSCYVLMAAMEGWGGTHILKSASERYECEDFVEQYFHVVNDDQLNVIDCFNKRG